MHLWTGNKIPDNELETFELLCRYRDLDGLIAWAFIINEQPEDAFFVGDDIVKGIGGCQHANIKGIWFNPHMVKNDTEIKPYAESCCFIKIGGDPMVLEAVMLQVKQGMEEKYEEAFVNAPFQKELNGILSK